MRTSGEEYGKVGFHGTQYELLGRSAYLLPCARDKSCHRSTTRHLSEAARRRSNQPVASLVKGRSGALRLLLSYSSQPTLSHPFFPISSFLNRMNCTHFIASRRTTSRRRFPPTRSCSHSLPPACFLSDPFPIPEFISIDR